MSSIFKPKYSIVDPIKIIFLCGTQYKKKNEKDKRIVLKKHIQNADENNYVVILEEHFIFKGPRKDYLSYHEIFLSNLKQIEEIVALFSDKIIIVHDSISTGAEIGMFASNSLVAQKMCVIIPDNFVVEEDKLSNFIQLAFFNNGDKPEKSFHPTKITYYPEIEIYHTSTRRSIYHTYFHQNYIGNNFDRKLTDFLNKNTSDFTYKFHKPYFKKHSRDNNNISYMFFKSDNNEDDFIDIVISSGILKYQLLALFSNDQFKARLRIAASVNQYVSIIEEEYTNIMKLSIQEIEGINLEDWKIVWNVRGATCDMRQIIGMFLFLLQAIGYIALEEDPEAKIDKKGNLLRKITIKTPLLEYTNKLSSMLEYTTATAFSQEVLNEE